MGYHAEVQHQFKPTENTYIWQLFNFGDIGD